MEKLLRSLFDYQKFEGNPHLDELIRDAEKYRDNALSDDELDGLNAAGSFYQKKKPLDDSKGY